MSPTEDLLRECAPGVLAALTRRYGRFDAAEDAVQEALMAAAQQWPVDGVPDNPRAWLITVAGRRLTDMFRSEAARRHARDRRGRVDPSVASHAPAADEVDLQRRHPHPAVPVLPSGADAAVAGGVDAARRGRPDHRADRCARSSCRNRPWDNGSAGRSRGPQGGRAVRHADAGRAAGPARRRVAGAVPDLQRGLHRDLRARPAARRPRRRGDPADPRCAPVASRRRRGRRPARADAADRRPSARAGARRRVAGPARRAGPHAVGPRR